MQFLVEKQESKSLPVPEVAKTRQQVNYDRPDGWGVRVTLDRGLESPWKRWFLRVVSKEDGRHCSRSGWGKPE